MVKNRRNLTAVDTAVVGFLEDADALGGGDRGSFHASDSTTKTLAAQAKSPCIQDGRVLIDRAQSERDFMAQVIRLAKLHGFLCHHQIVPFVWRGGRKIALTEDGTDRGFPDLVLCHLERGELLIIEVKREGGKLGPGQAEWRDALVRAGARYFLWTPGQWAEVERVLAGGTIAKGGGG